GSGPWIEFSGIGQPVRVPCSGDAALVHYMADRALGKLSTLAVSRSGTNRALIVFPQQKLPKRGSFERAILHLHFAESSNPIAKPLALRIDHPENDWDEATVTWNKFPVPSGGAPVEFNVQPNTKEVKVDITPMLRDADFGKQDLDLHIMSQGALRLARTER